MVSFNIRDKLDGDVLDLSLMNLKEVPLREIASLPRVRILDLSSNQIKTLPPNFGSALQHIVKLDLSANKLESLPKSFYQLCNLKHLDLYNNHITNLPESLHHLKSLRFLDLKNNPLNADLEKVVGSCLSQRECEAAAKKLVTHFNKEKQRAIVEQNQILKMKEAKQQLDRAEAEAKRVQNEKKAAKKDRKNENSKLKQQLREQQQQQQQQRNSNAKNANSNAANKKNYKAGKSSGSSFSLLNMLLLVALMSGAVWCLHIHVEGDYTGAGFRAAVPRLQKNLLKLRNMTAEALQPQNLRQTGTVIFTSVNSTAYQAGDLIKKGAYSAQEQIEVYTGDLTPYTSQVSKYCGIAYSWLKAQTCCMCDWLSKQDWQGMWDTTILFLSNVWTKLQKLWADIMSNPRVKLFIATVSEYCKSVVARCQELLVTLVQYLGENGPIWVENIKEASVNLYTSGKQSIEAMFK